MKLVVWTIIYGAKKRRSYYVIGFYICWGCLTFIPSLYTSPAMFLTNHPVDFPPTVTALLIALGCLMVYINYAADAQRLHFRLNNGDCLIWGRKPEYIVAEYTTENGKKMESLLLTSGRRYEKFWRCFFYCGPNLCVYFEG